MAFRDRQFEEKEEKKVRDKPIKFQERKSNKRDTVSKVNVNKVIREGAQNRLLSNISDEKSTDQEISKAIKSLGSITRNRKAAKRISRNKKDIKTLMDSINNRPRFTQLVLYSVECLKNLAVDEVSAEELIEEGCLDTLIKVLRLNPYNEQIQRAVNSAIQAFAKNERLASIIANKLGAKTMVFSLKKHVEPETLESTLFTAKTLMVPENMESFVQAGIIEAVASILQKHPDELKVLITSAEVLSALMSNPAYAKLIMESGAVDGVLKAMNAHGDAEALVMHGCALFSKLAFCDEKAVAYLKEQGAVDSIVAALEQHPYNAELLKLGADALSVLAGELDLEKAVATLSNNVNMVTAGAMAKMASFALVEENINYMVEHGAIKKIISALKAATGNQSPEAAKLLESGCHALARIACNEQNIYKIMKEGGVGVIVEILNKHADNPKICAAALAALSQLSAGRKENAVYVAEMKAIKRAVQCLGMHTTSKIVAKQAIKFLQNISEHEELIPTLVAEGCIQALLKVIKMNLDDKEVVSAAINTLGRLTNEENIREMVKAGGLDVFVDVLDRHYDDASLALKTIYMLELAAMIPENIKELRVNSAIPTILKAMEAHPDDEDLQDLAAKAMGLIAGEQQLLEAINVVKELSEALMKNPHLAAAILKKITPAVRLLGNLALVDSNIDFLIESGGIEVFRQTFLAAAKLKPSPQRDQLLAIAALGLARLGESDKVGAEDVALVQLFEVAVRNADNEKLIESIVRIAELMAENEENIAIMVKNGAIGKLIALAKAHPLNEKILGSAVRALGCMAADEQNVKLIIQQGGGVVVVESIYGNMQNVEVLLNALETLSQLAIDDPGVTAKLIEAGALDAIIEALRTHPDDADVVVAAMKALGGLVVNEEIAGLVGEKGGIPLLLNAMRTHYADDELIETGIILLDSLALVKANADILLKKEHGTVKLVNWAVETFPEHQELQTAAAKLLKTLGAVGKGVEEKTKDEPLSIEKVKFMINQLLDENTDPAQLLSVLQEIKGLAADEKAAYLFVTNGGLEALGKVILANRDNEKVFKAAAEAFQQLTKTVGEGALASIEEDSLLEALVEVVRPHQNFVEELGNSQVAFGLEYIGNLAKRPANIERLVKHGAIDPLLKFMTITEDQSVATATARVLAQISNDEDTANLLAQKASIRELISAMRNHMDQPKFLEYAVYLLANLAVNEQLKSAIGREGGISVIIDIMHRYPKEDRLIENCCYALGNLSFDNEVNISMIVACNGIPNIVKAVDNFNANESLLEYAICALGNLTFNSDANRESVCKCGGPKAIVAAILANFNQVDLLIQGFRTLGSLACYAPNITTIIQDGAVQGIVAGMTVHADQPELIQVAIQVLANFASELNKENMKTMAEEGAVQAIVEVAIKNTDQLDIEFAAIGCLINLAMADYNSRMIVKQGGVEAVVEAMKTLDFDDRLIHAGLRLLNVLTRNPSNVDYIIDTDAIQSILDAFQQYEDNTDLVNSGLRALFNMSSSDSNAGILAQKGCIQAVLSIIQGRVDDATALSEALRTLGFLSRTEKNAKSMAEKAMNVVVFALNKHKNDTKFAQFAFTFLTNLCVYGSAAEAVLKTKVIETILKSIDGFMLEMQVIKCALSALENMALSTNEVKDLMKKRKVIDSVKVIKETYAHKDDITKLCDAVIDAINRRIKNAPDIDVAKIVRNKNKKKRFDNQKIKKAKLDQDVRNMLISGSLFTKHSRSAKPKPRYVYFDNDLTHIFWCDPKHRSMLRTKKKDDEDAIKKMKTYKIKSIEKGRCTPQLQRKKGRMKPKFMAKEECSFAIHTTNRTLDLEAKTEQERDKWCDAIEQLIKYIKRRKIDQSTFY